MMRIRTFLLLAGTIVMVSTQSIPTQAVATMIKEILLPRNSEQNIQILKGPKRFGVPELMMRRSAIQEPSKLTLPVRKLAIVDAASPTLAKKVVLQKPRETMLPKKVILHKPIVVDRQPGFLKPKKVIIRNTDEVLTPKKIVLSKELATPTKNIIYPEIGSKKILITDPEFALPNKKIILQKSSEIPLLKKFIVKENSKSKSSLPKKVVVMANKEEILPMKPISEVKVAPVKKTKLELGSEDMAYNPFLPTASTVSGLANSNYAPQSRGQYLRKIPIPPPTI